MRSQTHTPSGSSSKDFFNADRGERNFRKRLDFRGALRRSELSVRCDSLTSGFFMGIARSRSWRVNWRERKAIGKSWSKKAWRQFRQEGFKTWHEHPAHIAKIGSFGKHWRNANAKSLKTPLNRTGNRRRFGRLMRLRKLDFQLFHTARLGIENRDCETIL